MSLLRVVGVLTSNAFKIEEIRFAFGPYGVAVAQLQPDPSLTVEDQSRRFLTSPLDLASLRIPLPRVVDKYRAVPFLAVAEQTTLVDSCGVILKLRGPPHCDCPLLTPATHISRLVAFRLEKRRGEDPELPSLTRIEAEARVQGFIDMSRREEDTFAPLGVPSAPFAALGGLPRSGHAAAPASAAAACFGWDDVFLVRDLNLTYLDLRRLHHKFSARDETLGELIRMTTHYRSPKDLFHTPLHPTGCLTFDSDPADFVLGCPEYRLGSAAAKVSAPPIRHANIPLRALNNGFFFRSATNRRENLYWARASTPASPSSPSPRM